MLITLAIASQTILGQVETTHARWSADGEVIITEARVRTHDGTVATVLQLGGTADGIGMTFSHMPAPLRADDVVELQVVTSQGHQVVTRARVDPRTSALASATSASYGLMHTRLSDQPLHRADGCLHIVYDAAGTAQVAGLKELDVLDQAFATWVDGTASCASLSFDRTVEPGVPAMRDGRDTVHFRDDSWCRPATSTEPELCYPHEAGAVTRVIFVDSPSDPDDGKILEADIDINAVDFALQVDGVSTTGGGIPIDLRSAVTHEIGHALGIAHNCSTGDDVWPTDLDGARVPRCDEVDAELYAATMYYRIDPGDTSKRTLDPSDQRAACAIVAAQSCQAEVTGGCAAGGGVSGLAIALACVPLLRRRRR